MAHDLHRAALAVLCVFAVIFAATLFPATGFGTNPVPSSGPGGGPADGTSSGDSQADGQSTTTAPATTGTGTPTTSTTPETTESPTTATTPETEADGSTTAGGSDETAPTTTATTTEAPVDDSASSGGLMGALLSLGTILAFFVSIVVATAVGFGRHHRRRHPGDWDLPSAPHLRVLAYVRRIPQTSLAFVMVTGQSAPGILDQLGSSFADATTGFGAATAGVGTLGAALGSAVVKIPAGFVTGIGAFGRGVGSLSLAWPSLSAGIGSGGFFSGSDDRPGADPRSGGRSDPVEAEPEEPEPPASVREAWDRLQEDLGVGGDDPRTPAEIARQAVDRGVPSDAARSLTRTFQDVRYGGRPDDGERVTVARRAYRRIRSALDGDSS